jgi:alpha-beta hydrolase superfamily lysophospholipase
MKKTKAPSTRSAGSPVLRWTGLILLVLLAVFLVFIYGFFPPMVAKSIVARSHIRQAITLTPKDDGFQYQDVSFKTDDGILLKGWWMPPVKKGKAQGTILLSHGVFHNRQQMLTRAEFLVQAGYQVLLFDFRGNGESGDSPVSGGLLESKDFLAAYQFLSQQHELQKPVLFYGFSLGAIAALRAGAAEGGDKIQAVIADSPLPNLKAYVSRRTMGGGFSFLPGFMGRCLSAYDALTGLSLTEEDLDLLPVVKRIQDFPVLYITGQKDDLARSPEVEKLFTLTPAPHRRLIYIPDADHDHTFSEYPIIYEREVMEFLNDLKAGFPVMKGPGMGN